MEIKNIQQDNILRCIHTLKNLPYPPYQPKTPNYKDIITLTRCHIIALERYYRSTPHNRPIGAYKGLYTRSTYTRYCKAYEAIRDSHEYDNLLSDIIADVDMELLFGDTSVVERDPDVDSRIEDLEEKIKEKDLEIAILKKKIEGYEELKIKTKKFQESYRNLKEEYDNKMELITKLSEEIKNTQKQPKTTDKELERRNETLRTCLRESKEIEVYYVSLVQHLVNYYDIDLEYQKSNPDFKEILKENKKKY